MDAEEDTREWRRVTAHVLRHTHAKHFHDELEDDVLRANLGTSRSRRLRNTISRTKTTPKRSAKPCWTRGS